MRKNYPLYDVEKFNSIKDMLNTANDDAGEKIAFRCKQDDSIKDITYSEFILDINSLGTALNSYGIKNIHMGIIAENSYKWLSVYFSALKGDGVFIPIDKDMSAEDKINIIASSDTDVLFYSEKQEAFLMENAEKLPSVKYFVGFDRKEPVGKFLSYDSLLESGSLMLEKGDTSYLDAECDETALKMLVYTSGTTENARGVMLSEKNILSCVYGSLQILSAEGTYLSVLPYHYTFEIISGVLASVYNRSTVCINDSLNSVLKNFQIFNPDFVYLVPAFAELFYKKIIAQLKQQKKFLSVMTAIKLSNTARKAGIDRRAQMFSDVRSIFGEGLKKIICCGGPVRSAVGRFFDSIGIKLVNGYVVTECTALVCANRDEFNSPSTAGIPIPCADIKIIPADNEECGEIAVRGDSVMLGYYKNPELTAKQLSKGGEFSTGDIGRINKKGQLVILGRKKNAIKLGNGATIYPEEIENEIMSLPYVEEVAVFPLKNVGGKDLSLGAEVYFSQEKLKEAQINKPEAKLKRDLARIFLFSPSYKKIAKVYTRAIPFEKTSSHKIKRSSIIHK